MTLMLVEMTNNHALLIDENAEKYVITVEQMRKTLNIRQYVREESCCMMPSQLSEQQVDSSDFKQFSLCRK